MTNERGYDVNRPLHDVIGTLLKLVLPAEQHALVPRITDMVAACKGVAEHRGKLWGELSESEANIVAAASASSLTRSSARADRQKRDTPCIDLNVAAVSIEATACGPCWRPHCLELEA